MILIVGGCGYIGSHTNKELAKRGYETIVVDNLKRGHLEFAKWGRLILGDLADTELLRLIFKTYPIKVVMHFSALAYVGESVANPQEYYFNNVANTLNLFQVMLEHNVKNLIFSSSCATYGYSRTIPITEDHPQEPINPYGQTKLTVEKILRDYDHAYALKYVTLRYFNAAGADPEGEIGEWHEPETHLIPLALDVAAGNSQNIKIYGTDYQTNDGTCIRDYIHVTDLANAHILAMEYLLDVGVSECFNLGNGKGFSVREILKTVKSVTGTTVNSLEWERRPGDPPILIGDYRKAKANLNWKPEYDDICVIVSTAWNWHKTLRSNSADI